MFWPLLVLPLIPTSIRFILACHVSLINLRRSDDYAVLPFSPNELSVSDVVLVIILFIARSLKKSLGFRSARRTTNPQGDSQATTSSTNSSGLSQDGDQGQDARSLPALQLAMPLRIRSSDMNQYLAAISHQLPSSSSTTTTSPFTNKAHQSLFLSAISEPALLLLLARPGCPIEPLGAVNVRNRFEILHPDLCRRLIQPTFTSVSSKQDHHDSDLELSVLASLPPTSHPVKRGIETDVTVSIYTRERHQSDPTLWADESTECFRQVFTILQFVSSPPSSPPTSSSTHSSTSGDHASSTASKPSSIAKAKLKDTSPTQLTHAPNLATYFPISTRDPLLWASLCRDYNPIHISSVAAKAFGFKSVVAHGNHVVARAVEVGGIGEEGRERAEEGGGGRWWMEVSFRRPVVLPCEVGIRAAEGTSGAPGRRGETGREGVRRHEVFDGEKVFVEIAMGR